MKKMSTLQVILLSMFFIFQGFEGKAKAGNEITSGRIDLHYTSSLASVAETWMSEYARINPDLYFTLLSDPQIKGEGLFLVRGNELAGKGGEIPWKVIIGRDALVPVTGTANPYLPEILEKGIPMEGLYTLAEENHSWNTLSGYLNNTPVHIYRMPDPATAQALQHFFSQRDIAVTVVAGGDDLAMKLAADPLAIGFCRVTDLLSGKMLQEKTHIIPIDRNGNGRIDGFEKIAGNPEDLLRGIWTGKYPRELCDNIYLAGGKNPGDPASSKFVKWVLTSGQQYLNENGIAELGENERIAKIDLLDKEITRAEAGTERSPVIIWLVIFGVVAIAGIMLSFAFRKKNVPLPKESRAGYRVIHENTVTIPKGVFFDKSHTWAFMEKDGLVRIGLDDFMHRITGPITRVALRQPGEEIRKGEKIFTLIQDGKQLNILSPVSGTIRSCNTHLSSRPYLLTEAPFGDGWIYVVEPANWLREMSFMFMSDKYSEWIRGEFSRIRDFFATSVTSRHQEYAQVILQDGGELRENLLSEFGPEVWEDFQTKFIETSL